MLVVVVWEAACGLFEKCFVLGRLMRWVPGYLIWPGLKLRIAIEQLLLLLH